MQFIHCFKGVMLKDILKVKHLAHQDCTSLFLATFHPFHFHSCDLSTLDVSYLDNSLLCKMDASLKTEQNVITPPHKQYV